MDYYKFNYKTPEKFSNIIMSSDGEFLTGLWFEDSRDTLKHKIDSTVSISNSLYN